MSYHIDLEPPVPVGSGPFGMRLVFTARGGTFEGPRLRGTIHQGGGNWVLVGADGLARLDARFTFQTDDGAAIFESYFGLLEFGERTQRATEGGPPTEYGEIKFLSQPRFETGDQRYAWLNTVVAVSEGRVLESAVEYNVYEVRQD